MWTANKESVLREIAPWGIDHIMSDYPDVAMRYVAEFGGKLLLEKRIQKAHGYNGKKQVRCVCERKFISFY